MSFDNYNIFDYDQEVTSLTSSTIDVLLNSIRSPNHQCHASYLGHSFSLNFQGNESLFSQRVQKIFEEETEFDLKRSPVPKELFSENSENYAWGREEHLIKDMLGMVISPVRSEKRDVGFAQSGHGTGKYLSLPLPIADEDCAIGGRGGAAPAKDMFEDFEESYYDEYPRRYTGMTVVNSPLFRPTRTTSPVYEEDSGISLQYDQFKKFFQTQKNNMQTFTPTKFQTPKIKRVEISAKGEPQITPNSKEKYKDYHKAFKAKEKESYGAALEYAASCLEDHLLEKVSWKIQLDIADLAKRNNDFETAKKYYTEVNTTQPQIPKGWLEHAKMEEENGNLEECKSLLLEGLNSCGSNEALLIKGVKHCERMGCIDEARAMIGNLINVSIDRSWRTILEGGLFEARQGNIYLARKIFKFLTTQVPNYGPIYTEAVNLELRIGDYERAMKVITRGIEQIPTYGPLWFLSLEVAEILGRDCVSIATAAIESLSQELTWKVHFEMAEIHVRSGDHKAGRKSFVNAALNCPSNLVWKVWLGGAQSELLMGNSEEARRLLICSFQHVPEKMKATVLLEMAKAEEYLNQLGQARYYLRKAKEGCRSEWKVHLEAVLLEIRANEMEQAYVEVRAALKIHPSTGRLWALYIQLSHLLYGRVDGIKKPIEVFVKALDTVPKSGEVWCEGARLAMAANDFERARKYLEFAVLFTPQYGDSFIEALRLVLLRNPPSQRLAILQSEEIDFIVRKCLNAEPTYGICWSFCQLHPLERSRHCMINSKTLLKHLIERSDPQLDIASYFATMDIHKIEDETIKFRIIYS